MMNSLGLEVRGLSKRFGTLQALDTVDLHLQKGKIYGLLGRNGAGKSTLLNILDGRLRATSGSFTIDGQKTTDDRVRCKMYLVSPDNLYPAKKLKDILAITSSFFPSFALQDALADLERFDLSPNSRFDKLSTGNGSLFKAVVALRSGAEYIFLDEPTLGHDAVNRQMFYETVLSVFADTQSCIVLSSHLIAEVAPLLQEVIFIRKGKILFQEDVEELMSRYRFISGTATAVQTAVQAHSDMRVVQKQEVGALAQWIVEYPAWSAFPAESEVNVQAVDLQSLFIALTQDPTKGVDKMMTTNHFGSGTRGEDAQQQERGDLQ